MEMICTNPLCSYPRGWKLSSPRWQSLSTGGAWIPESLLSRSRSGHRAGATLASVFCIYRLRWPNLSQLISPPPPPPYSNKWTCQFAQQSCGIYNSSSVAEHTEKSCCQNWEAENQTLSLQRTKQNWGPGHGLPSASTSWLPP